MPYIIALSSFAMVGDDNDVLEALYGPEIVIVDRNEPGSAELGRSPQGLWQRGSQTSYTRVSAVLAANNMGINMVGNQWPRLWPNPWAASPLTENDLPWPTGTGDLERNIIERANAEIDPATFFDLPEGWPGEPFAAKRRRRRQCLPS
jgi:hypothetical protein